MQKQITTDVVNKFLNGHDPMEHIITIETDYNDSNVYIIYVDDKGVKRVKQDAFKPFVWAKNSVCIRMFEGNRIKIAQKLREYGIVVRKLITTFNEDGSPAHERLEEGYKYIFQATKKMSYTRFMQFFNEAGTPIFPRKKKKGKEEEILEDTPKEFMALAPTEQYMIATGRRLFKGYENYDDLHRVSFDLETEGLKPRIHRIEQIGIHDNKGFDLVIPVITKGLPKEEADKIEIDAITKMIRILSELKPDALFGHNSENFDWDFIIVRCEELGISFEKLTETYFRFPIYKKKKPATLKLGGETETYYPTVVWGVPVLDSLHAARRAQAIDSSMKLATLKYVTKYLNLKKPNRVYVPGDKISSTYSETEKVYAFNNTDGDWYKISDKHPLKDGYEYQSGRYIVERYLLDDIWETDKVELSLNEANFLVAKMLPTTFSRVCTMGTAGIWKLIMLGWAYENNLAVPNLVKKRRFTGGLSRLLKTGFVSDIVKLDYNSLYPSIMLTWNIESCVDISHSINSFLNYVLTEREYYKGLKADAGSKVDELKEKLKTGTFTKEEQRKIEEEINHWKAVKASNDKKQLPLKILGNSVFGAFGNPTLFPWGDCDAAERVTCIGRQSLRLMISHFTKIGYTPVVGDSVLGDTPLYVKYDNGLIDIKPIADMIDEENVNIDALGREYDYSKKQYKVLCRSGWQYPSYVYRHKTDKKFYRINDGKSSVDVTEDHSLYDSKQNKIAPRDIKSNTQLEYHTSDSIFKDFNTIQLSDSILCRYASSINSIDKLPITLMNSTIDCKKTFVSQLQDVVCKNKTVEAGLLFIKNCIDG